LKVHLHHFSKIKSQKEVKNSRNQGFSYYFGSMIEGSGSGAGSGSGPRRPKNRIRNTAAKRPKTFCPRKQNILLASLRVLSSAALILNSLLFMTTYSECKFQKQKSFSYSAIIRGGTIIPRILNTLVYAEKKDFLPAT
jgi:hypothetical protein